MVSTKSRVFFFLIVSLVAASPSWGAGWALKFGKGPAQVQYYNASVAPKIQEAAALGPMSFRINGEDLWVADSIAGRLICLGPGGRVKVSIHLPNAEPNTLIEDFALMKDGVGRVSAIWVADGADGLVRLLRVPDGKELLRVGGRGNEMGKFLQIHQVEVGPTGRLYVGDYGRRTISIFEPAGRLVREISWKTSGFYLDTEENLSLLTYTEGSGYIWVKYDRDGNLFASIHLGMANYQNPRLWSMNRGGEILVSFIPPGGYRGVLNLMAFAQSGMMTANKVFRPPCAMNRFLEVVEAAYYLAEADFDAAPRGEFVVKKLVSEGKK